MKPHIYISMDAGSGRRTGQTVFNATTQEFIFKYCKELHRIEAEKVCKQFIDWHRAGKCELTIRLEDRTPQHLYSKRLEPYKGMMSELGFLLTHPYHPEHELIKLSELLSSLDKEVGSIQKMGINVGMNQQVVIDLRDFLLMECGFEPELVLPDSSGKKDWTTVEATTGFFSRHDLLEFDAVTGEQRPKKGWKSKQNLFDSIMQIQDVIQWTPPMYGGMSVKRDNPRANSIMAAYAKGVARQTALRKKS